MTTVTTRMFGLAVEADAPLLAGLGGIRALDADLRITLGTQQDNHGDEPPGTQMLDFAAQGRRWQTATSLSGGGWILRFWGVCDVWVEPSLRRADVLMLPDVDVGLADVLARGAIPAFVLLLSGHGVLHASATVVGGVGVATVGRAGMGKSTVAAMLCAAGGRLVTDDVLRFVVADDGVVGYAGTDELRLRRESDVTSKVGATRVTVDGRRAVRPRFWAHDTAPIDVVMLPRLRRDVTRVRAYHVQGAESLLCLLRFPRFPGLVEPDIQAAQLNHAAALAGRVPVIIVDIPWGVGPSVALGESIRQNVERALESSVLA